MLYRGASGGHQGPSAALSSSLSSRIHLDPIVAASCTARLYVSYSTLPPWPHRRATTQHKQPPPLQRSEPSEFCCIFDFILAHPLWEAARFHQRCHAEVYSNFSRSAGLDSGRQKTRHKQKLILATGTAAVSNAFSCAGLGRL